MSDTIVHIILSGLGGELDRRTVRGDDDNICDRIQEAVIDLAADCILAIGDTITIVEG